MVSCRDSYVAVHSILKGETMKILLENLLGAEQVLGLAQHRGTIPVNYAIHRNLELIRAAVAPFREAQKTEPLCWLRGQRHESPQDAPQSKKGEAHPKIGVEGGAEDEEGSSGEGQALARESLNEWLKTGVEFEPYRIPAEKVCDSLRGLSPAREKLSSEQLGILNEDFSVVVIILDILKEE